MIYDNNRNFYSYLLKQHLKSLFKELCDESELDIQAKRNLIAHIYWWTAVACFSSKGSAAVSNSLLEVLCRDNKIKTGPAKGGIALDLEAMLTPEDEFVAKLTSGEYGRMLAA